MEGRYLAMVATQYRASHMVTEYFLKMKRFVIITRCGHDIHGIDISIVLHRLLSKSGIKGLQCVGLTILQNI